MGDVMAKEMPHFLDKRVTKVGELLALENLVIPQYQRPYKWTQANLADLLNDLKVYRDKSAYRLGAVVFHRHYDGGNVHEKVEQLDIVDGQQRTLTLMLLVQALIEERLQSSSKHQAIKRQDVRECLQKLKAPLTRFLAGQRFSSDISHHNLHQNFMAAKRAVSRSDFTEADIDFLLNRCEVVTFVLDDVSEAFQFFDSQNARGRDLDPHDLLKAFHLREFSDQDNELKAQSVSHWESLQSKQLANLFANYLFRIRNWAQGKPAQYFGKSQVGLFKGVNLEQVGLYPYVEPLRISHHFVDDYNSQYQRKIDHQTMGFPFHLDQMIINGRRFFEMTSHYQRTISSIIDSEHAGDKHPPITILGHELEPLASRILRTLNSYSSRTRTGDGYVRTLFDCGVIFYLDKFGANQLSQAIEKLFIWAYRCRLKKQVVQLMTMDNHALKHNVFERIKQAIQPSDVLNWPLPTIKQSEVKGTKLVEIERLFQEMKYYE
ncbi:DUF262 domain-containing protein [Vibrio campbellii]|uniref:DUF262 domain-containing protein n=1 Tax=Vibrio campbellii TaxID=680 RepID=UPI001F395D54|nr:DUF262 domain-containing protein [Vibrio campbellii]MCE7728504.1 DUF262 domain-containing protein [Vibrio campbellii]